MLAINEVFAHIRARLDTADKDVEELLEDVLDKHREAKAVAASDATSTEEPDETTEPEAPVAPAAPVDPVPPETPQA